LLLGGCHARPASVSEKNRDIIIEPIFKGRLPIGMQLSYYIKSFPCEEKPDHRLLFSTKKASAVLIAEKTYQAIIDGTLSPSDEALLARLGIVVSDRKAEREHVSRLLDDLNNRNPALNITVVLNLDCNFACVYCYEGERKGKRYMSEKTAAHLQDFVKEKFTREKRNLFVDFFGGEPLLSSPLIKSISKSMIAVAEKQGASYGFGLITNGSLFTRRMAQALLPLGLRSVKITLDGPPEIHNQFRPFKSGEPSFEVIIKNLKETCDLVKISIGGNFQANTYKEFPRLLDRLLAEGLTPDRIPLVKFDPVMNTPVNDISPAVYKGGCLCTSEPWLLAAESFLREEILRRGFNTLKPAPRVCMIENRDSFVVNFDGLIYKCPAFIGRNAFVIGDLQEGVRDWEDIYKPGMWKNEKCAACEYLPLCFGGCRYMTFIQSGKIDALDCKQPYFDASLERMIKQDIKHRLKSEAC
jgi:uncharacterized protein